MNFFFDNCISPKYAEAMKILSERKGYKIFHLMDKFDRSNVRDEEWISTLATEGNWIIISGDTRITKGKAEKKAWSESKLTAFFFEDKWASRSFWTQISELIRVWPLIEDEIKKGAYAKGYLMPFKSNKLKLIL